MSHFAEIKVSALVKNEKELVAALENFFGEGKVEVSKTATTLQGYDSAARKCAHVVVRKNDVAKANGKNHAYNDLGFERTKEGTYTMHVDNADLSPTHRNKVIQDYADRVAQKQLKAKGYTVKRELMKDGTVKLTASRYA